VGLIPSTAYGLLIDWRLTWAPVRADAPIDRPHVRAATIRRSSSNPHEVLQLGVGLHEEGDRLVPGDAWAAFATVGTTAAGSFTVALELQFGGPARRDSLVLPPAAREPFMLSVPARVADWAGTVLVLDGVAVTAPRPSVVSTLRELARRIFG
jgi:hypothetical protein